MTKLFFGLLIAACCLRPAADCCAQGAARGRIERVEKLPIWRRTILSERELRQALDGVVSDNPALQRAGIETLANAKPIPQHAELVIRGLTQLRSSSQDRTTQRLTIEACRDWDVAKKAWDTLQEARRRGGFRALEQAITDGSAPRLGDIMIAAAYSDDERAPRLLAENWRTSRLHGGQALEIIGPPAAPFLAEQLDPADIGLCLEVVKHLAKIGTEAEIPRLEEVAPSTNRLLQQMIKSAIEEIKSRAGSAE